MVSATAATGLILGALAGHYTVIYRCPDGMLVGITLATIILWVAGTIGRLVFGLFAEHGGGPSIAAFSSTHGIGIRAWGSALILMALCEVLGRTIVLGGRALSPATETAAQTALFRSLPSGEGAPGGVGSSIGTHGVVCHADERGGAPT